MVDISFFVLMVMVSASVIRYLTWLLLSKLINIIAFSCLALIWYFLKIWTNREDAKGAKEEKKDDR